MEEYEDYNYDTECGSGCLSSTNINTSSSEIEEEDNYDTDGRNS